jgi:hypothetical protein
MVAVVHNEMAVVVLAAENEVGNEKGEGPKADTAEGFWTAPGPDARVSYHGGRA